MLAVSLVNYGDIGQPSLVPNCSYLPTLLIKGGFIVSYPFIPYLPIGFFTAFRFYASLILSAITLFCLDVRKLYTGCSLRKLDRFLDFSLGCLPLDDEYLMCWLELITRLSLVKKSFAYDRVIY